ncbi:MAG: sortase-associated OmpA-like protein PdsO [Sulfuriflexus sp.]|nr:sortase-associated OmpA-like protein PdsO [Sulfuriflexus sp.]
MKNMTMALSICIALASTSVQATDIYGEDDSFEEITLNEAGGLGLGAVVGAVLGGPIGAIAGGVMGGMTASASDTEEELALMYSKLEQSEHKLNKLKKVNHQLARQAVMQRTALSKKTSASFDFSSLDTGFSMAVQFRRDSHLLEPAFIKQLSDIAKSFSGVEKLHIHLSGHADREGGDAYNQLLSEQRVKSVAKALCRAGWPKQRMHITAHGESRPLSSEKDKQGYAFDRRVGLLLSTAGVGI